LPLFLEGVCRGFYDIFAPSNPLLSALAKRALTGLADRGRWAMATNQGSTEPIIFWLLSSLL